jgi:hypothetical protein
MSTLLWVLWAVMFAVIELVALTNDRYETLSTHLRRWFRTDTHIGRTVWLCVSGLFMAWFIVHIAVAGST